MKRTWLHIIILVVFSLVLSCQEEYFPELKNVKPALVIDAYITDQSNGFKISWARPFQSDENPGLNLISTVEVRLSVSDGTVYHWQTNAWTNPFPPELKAEPGKTYTLEVKVNFTDGKQSVFASTPQTMPNAVVIDEVYGEFEEELFFFHATNINYTYYRYVEGTNTLIRTSTVDGTPARFRFETEMYAQYVKTYGGDTVTDEYCWIRRPITDYAGSDINELFSDKRSKPTRLAFIPDIPTYYRFMGFPNQTFDGASVIATRIFTLNQEAYLYHKSKNDQLSGTGRFFDPIAAQVVGNLSSQTDPDELVFGFFEVSAESVYNFFIKANRIHNFIEVIPLEFNYLSLPSEGCVLNIPPDFWKY